MDPVFRSKIDVWLVIALVGVPFLVLEFLLDGVGLNERAVDGLALLTVAVVIGIVLWFYLSTRYTITSEFLLVNSGPFMWAIPLHDIISIEPTRSPISSPALSLDRLLIRYGHSAELMISPKNQAGFISELNKRMKTSPARAGSSETRKPAV